MHLTSAIALPIITLFALIAFVITIYYYFVLLIAPILDIEIVHTRLIPWLLHTTFVFFCRLFYILFNQVLMHYLLECLLYAGLTFGVEPDSILWLGQTAEPITDTSFYSELNLSSRTSIWEPSHSSPPLSRIWHWSGFNRHPIPIHIVRDSSTVQISFQNWTWAYFVRRTPIYDTNDGNIAIPWHSASQILCAEQVLL